MPVQRDGTEDQPTTPLDVATSTVLDALQAKVGMELGLSEWILVEQSMIDRFADLTGDHQFIHVDPERAAATPLGGTIAHGFFLLSLLPTLLRQANVRPPAGLSMALNYGTDRIRFASPVHVGRRVRGRFTLASARVRHAGQIEQILAFSIETEGAAKPAVVGTWINLFVVGA